MDGLRLLAGVYGSGSTAFQDAKGRSEGAAVAAPYADSPERSGGANPYEIAAAIGHAALCSRSCTDLRRHHVPAKQQVQHERGQQHFQSLMLRARAATQQSGHCILYGKVKTRPK